MYKKILAFFDIPTWLFLLLLGVLILRIPSFFEPYSYGDETIYLTLGEAIRRGIPLYSGVHDNKPPLLYLVAAIAGNLFWFKAILAIWSIITIKIFWEFSQYIFSKQKVGVYVSVIVFALFTTIPLLEGNIANAEIFMIGPTILGFLLLLKSPTFLNIFIAGLLFSTSALFKIPAIFDIGTIVFFWLIFLKKFNLKNIKDLVAKLLIFGSGFLLPIATSFVIYYLQGSLKEYLYAAFLQNVGYLSSWRPEAVQKSFIEKNLPLLVRLSVVILGSLILFLKRSKLSREFVFVSLWILFSLFGVTLSERPYPHYLIQSVGAISLLFGFFVARKNYEQVFAVIPLAVAFFVPFYFHFWLYPTITYYQRFLNFATGSISRDQYLYSFGANVPGYYKVSQFMSVTTKPTDKIFVWGEGSQIYALSKRFPPGKYVADYHIQDFSTDSELTMVLSNDKPAYFLLLPKTRVIPQEISDFISNNYYQIEPIENINIWKLLASKN